MSRLKMFVISNLLILYHFNIVAFASNNKALIDSSYQVSLLSNVLVVGGLLIILVSVYFLIRNLSTTSGGDVSEGLVSKKTDKIPGDIIKKELDTVPISKDIPPVDILKRVNTTDQSSSIPLGDSVVTSGPSFTQVPNPIDINNLPKVPLSELTSENKKHKVMSLNDIVEGPDNNQVS